MNQFCNKCGDNFENKDTLDVDPWGICSACSQMDIDARHKSSFYTNSKRRFSR